MSGVQVVVERVEVGNYVEGLAARRQDQLVGGLAQNVHDRVAASCGGAGLVEAHLRGVERVEAHVVGDPGMQTFDRGLAALVDHAGQVRHRDLIFAGSTEFGILDHVAQFKNGTLFDLIVFHRMEALTVIDTL